MSKSPYTLPSTAVRDWAIGVGVAVIILAIVIYAVMNMGSGLVGNSLTGTITAKHFTAQPVEERATVGKGGLYTQTVDGDYTFEVSVRGHIYTVWVDKALYQAKHEGDTFVFLRPRE